MGTRMKVIFDYSALANWTGHATGIQRVVSEVGRALQRQLPNTHLGVFGDDGDCQDYVPEGKKITRKIPLEKGDIIVTAGSNWDYRELHEGLLSLGKRGVRLSTLFYDVIPVLFPFFYGPGFSPIYEKWLNESLSASDLSFTVSENSRRDLEQYAISKGINCQDIHVIRLGDDVPISTAPVSESITSITGSPYILSVGTLEYRKNHVQLLNAYRYMLERWGYTPPKLYIVGSKGWLDHDIEYQVANDGRLNSLVEILHGISDSDMRYLYEKSLFTVYPSFYEGWGLPVAESMCIGKPCIASRSSSMVEIAPSLVNYADPYLVNEWAAQIRGLAENPKRLNDEARHIRNTYVRRSWDETAIQIKDVLLQYYPELMAHSS